MVDCAKGGCAAWHSRSALAGVQPQPRRRRLEQRDIALTSLMTAQQLGRFGRRHADGCADRGGRRDVARVQLLEDQHAQTYRSQPVGVSGAALFGRELELGRWRRLVRASAPEMK
jgi:hypothetical protein